MIEPFIICADGAVYAWGETSITILHGVSSSLFLRSDNLISGLPIATMILLYSTANSSISAQVPTTSIPFGVSFLLSSTNAIFSKQFPLPQHHKCLRLRLTSSCSFVIPPFQFGFLLDKVKIACDTYTTDYLLVIN